MGKINSYKNIGDYDKAEENYIKASYIVPNRLYPKFCLAKMYKEYNKLDKLDKITNEVLNSEAKFPSRAEKEIKNNIRKLLSNPGRISNN